VVVEAAPPCGAATTARWADELARALMVVPGPITSAMSAGSNELLRSRNAIAVTRPAEIIEAIGSLGTDLAPPRLPERRPRDDLPQRLVDVLEALPRAARRARTGWPASAGCTMCCPPWASWPPWRWWSASTGAGG
jgi:DNA processing protein